MERISGKNFGEWRKKYGITIYLAGKLFGFSHKTVSAWNVGQNPVPPCVAIMVSIFDRNVDLLRIELKRAEEELEAERAARKLAA